MQKRNFDSPDATHASGERGKVEVITLGGVTVRRLTFQPGWKWSEDAKPTAETDSCQIPHLNVHVSGRLGVRMDDGTEQEFGPGDVGLLPAGHDAWVIGEEPVVIIEQTP